MKKTEGTLYIKNKFATLLSKMVTDGGLSYNEITNKLIEDNFLDCFETNDIKEFYDKSYESIIYSLFKKECVYHEGIDPVVYWCGLQYMNLFLNKRIPLKQLLILCPLSKMESYYKTYHELNDSKFIDVFMKKEYSNSILKQLRNNRNYSIRELSLLSSISPNTLKYYEDNHNLYKASFSNIIKLLNILDYSDSVVKEKTCYIPPSFSSLLKIKEIKKFFNEYIHMFFNTNDDIEYNLGVFWLKSNRNKKIDKEIVDSAIVFAIEKYEGNKLLF